ncbi:uncharacterized protein LOC144084699 [Stigmatopora argus]
MQTPTNATIGKSKELSMDLKKRILDLNKSGKSLGAISKQLQVPRATVQTIVCKYKVHGTVLSLPRSGRKRKLSPAADRKLIRRVKIQPRITKKQRKSWADRNRATRNRATRNRATRNRATRNLANRNWTDQPAPEAWFVASARVRLAAQVAKGVTCVAWTRVFEKLGAAWSGEELGVAWSAEELGAAWSAEELGAAWSAEELGAAWSAEELGAAWSAEELGAAWSAEELGAAWSAEELGAAWSAEELGAAWSAEELGQGLERPGPPSTSPCGMALAAASGRAAQHTSRHVVAHRSWPADQVKDLAAAPPQKNKTGGVRNSYQSSVTISLCRRERDREDMGTHARET